MTRYAAFLRGINIGSSNKIAMPELRALVSGLGHDEVATYINSGNVVFTGGASSRSIERDLSAAIAEQFNLSIDVAVRSADQLEAIVAANPYPDGNPSQVTIAFLTADPPRTAPDRVAALATEAEPFTFAGREVYVNYTKGQGRSKLAERFSAAVGVSATVRNLRTVQRVLGLARA